jgi:hypothetical protein
LPRKEGAYVVADVSAESPNESWGKPVRVTFRYTGGGWKLVGLERIPEAGKI